MERRKQKLLIARYSKMILVINVNKYKLHDLEFINPITDLFKKFKVVHYRDLKQKNIDSAEKIIIAGTSLKDDEYLKDIEIFSWIKNCKKPILGICAGAQIIALVFSSKLRKMQEIGMIKVKFDEEFFGINQEIEAYSLHNLGFKKIGEELQPVAFSEKGVEAFKHNSKHIYGILFHPEVKNKEIIKSFIKIK